MSPVETDSNGRCSVLIPESANVDGKYADHLAYVSSLFLAKTCVSEDRRNGEGIPFHTRNWDKITRAKCDGRSVRELSLDAGVVEVVDRRFMPGERSITYRLPDRCRDGRFREHVINKQVVRRWLGIKCDDPLDSTATALTSMFPQFGIGTEGVELSKWDRLALAKIERCEFYGVRCAAGRFYSTFTGLRRDLRQNLFIKNSDRRLCSVDVSCCQPAIWSSLPFVCSSPSLSLLSVPLSLSPSPEGTKKKGKPASSICAQVFGSSRRQTRDVAEWAELCRVNYLYDHLASLTGLATRDDAKPELCVALYGHPDSVGRLPMARALRKHFSTIWLHSLAVRKDDYRASAWMMQSAERALMIDGVAARYLREFPGDPILTVHDDIIVPVDREPAIRSFILDQFARLEVVPHIKPLKLLGAAETSRPAIGPDC